MNQRLSKALLVVNWLTANLAAAVLLFSTAMLLLDVVMRAFNRPLLGTIEIAEMAMVFILFGALSLIESQGKQIRVELLTAWFGPRICGWLDRISYGFAASLWLALAWSIWHLAELSTLLNMSSTLLRIPRAPFQYLLCLMAIITALTCTHRIFMRPISGGADE